MSTSLFSFTINGRQSFALLHDGAMPPRGALGTATQLWDVPVRFADASIEEVVRRWREYREYTYCEPIGGHSP